MSTMTDRPFRHLCPEADLRDAMDDGEFWDHVFNRHEGPDYDYDPDDDPNAPDPDELVMNPCAVCGEWGPCAYDAEGRVLVHWQPPVNEGEDS